jgi:hypothetical protein
MSVIIPIVAADGAQSTVTLAAPVITGSTTGFPYIFPFPFAAAAPATSFPYTLPFPL